MQLTHWKYWYQRRLLSVALLLYYYQRHVACLLAIDGTALGTLRNSDRKQFRVPPGHSTVRKERHQEQPGYVDAVLRGSG